MTTDERFKKQCVCVCEREREKETERGKEIKKILLRVPVFSLPFEVDLTMFIIR